MRINTMLLADDAQVTANRLSLNGGLWDQLNAPGFPASHRVVAVLLLAPEAGDVDANVDAEVVVLDQQDVEVGRASAVLRVEAFAEQVAAVVPVTVVMQNAGDHTVVARLGAQERRLTFRVSGPVAVPPLLRNAGR